MERSLKLGNYAISICGKLPQTTKVGPKCFILKYVKSLMFHSERHSQDVASCQGGGNWQHIAKRAKISGPNVQQANDSNVGGENAQFGGTRNYCKNNFKYKFWGCQKK